MGEESEPVGPRLGPSGLPEVTVEWKRQAADINQNLGSATAELCLWASYITSLSICKMGIMVLPELL